MIKERKDKKNFIFLRSEHSFSVLNIYPYNNGHVLVVPNRHVNDIIKLKTEEVDDLMRLVGKTKVLLDGALKSEGYNLGMNLGKVAGAGVPGHIHIHIVPRWKGDVNFMPVVSGTKVISQSLKSVFDLLTKANKNKQKGR